MMSLRLFILSIIGVIIRWLSLTPLQEKMLRQNLVCKQCKIAVSQYRKNVSIWELGKNKFT
jgi:hypothetical protein